MDNDTRLQYLEAMGIDVWVPRVSAEPACEEITAPASLDSAEPADSWEALQAEVAPCTHCELCKTRTQTVFGSGDKNAEWMFIGEGPGQSEDLQGLPFVGKAGQLLTEMLRAIGFERDQVFIANIVKCRPPGNRDPSPAEVEACKPFLLRQLALIRPKIIVALGRVSAQTLLDSSEPIGKLRGKLHTFNDIPLVVIYHPAYLLRSLTEKRKAWTDLKFAMKTVEQIKGRS